MAEDEFEVLVSTQDYLKLEKQCLQLKSQNEKLTKERREITAKLFDLGQENGKLVKKVAYLNDANKYLSLKGIEQSKAFLELDSQKIDLKQSVIETQKNLTMKLKQSLKEQKTLEKKMEILLSQNSRTVSQLEKAREEVNKISGKTRKNCQVQTNVLVQDVSVMSQQSSSDVNKKIENFKQKILHLEDQTKSLNEVTQITVQELNSVKESSEKIQKDLQNQRNTLKNIIEKEKKSASSSKTQSQQLQNKVKTLQTEIQNNNKRITEQEDQNMKLSETISKLKSQIKQKNTQNQECTKKLILQIDTKEKNIGKFIQESNKFKQQNRLLMEQMDVIKMQMENNKEDFCSLRQQNEKMMAKLKNLEEEKASLLQKFSIQIKTMEKSIAQNNKIEQELGMEKQIRSYLENQLKTLQEKYKDEGNKNMESKEKIQQMQRVVYRFQVKYEQLELSLGGKIKVEKQQAQKKFQKQIEDLKKQKQNLCRLQAEYDEIIETLSQQMREKDREIEMIKNQKRQASNIRRKKSNSMELMRNLVEEHFSQLLVNLSEMDSHLSEEQFRNLLGGEMNTVTAYMNDSVGQLLELKFGNKHNNGNKKKKN